MSPENTTRRPGEAVFAVFLALLSAALVWQAYGIAGFEALSSPGAFPIAVTSVMVISSLIILTHTLRKPTQPGNTFLGHVATPLALIMTGLIVIFGFALQPLGFLPSAYLFLVVGIKILSKRSFAYSLGIALFCLVLIYIVFRLVFSVLMPEGIVPEREILAWIGNLFGGTN